MKILYLCIDGIDIAGKSGGAIHLRSFVRALGEVGHEVSVVCSCASSPASLEAELQARVQPAPRTPWNHSFSHAIAAGNRFLGRSTRHNPDAVRVLHNLRFLKVAADAARQFGPDFIYERYTLWGLAGLRLAKARSIPLVLEVNAPLAYEQERYRAGLTCPPLAGWVERRIWRKADLVIAISESLRRRLEEAGVAPARTRILPNAADARLFHLNLEGESVRNRFNLHGRFVVGFVGAFRPWHGVDLMLDGFEEFHREDSSSHLLLVGDGPSRPLYEDKVRKMKLQEAVTFVGGVAHEDVPGFLAAMDVAVAPYPAVEDFYYSPLKLFEYMAAGRAVVASRIGQVAEIIVDGVTGLLFDPGDRSGLVSSIRSLRRDAERRIELGRRAAEACSEHTWNRNAARVIDWVQPLVERKREVALPG